MALIKCDKCGHLIDSSQSKCPICDSIPKKKSKSTTGSAKYIYFSAIIVTVCVLLLLLPFFFQLPNVVWYSTRDGQKEDFLLNDGDVFPIFDVYFGQKRVLFASNRINLISNGSKNVSTITLPKYAIIGSVTTNHRLFEIYGETYFCANGLLGIHIAMNNDLHFDGWWSNCEELGVVKRHRYYDYSPGINALIESETNTLIAGCHTTSIPDYVEAIGPKAFYGSENLVSVKLPESIVTIDEEAFSNCPSLTSIMLNSSLEEVFDGAFFNCPKLTSIVIPENCKLLGTHIFDENIKYIVYIQKDLNFSKYTAADDVMLGYTNVFFTIFLFPGSTCVIVPYNAKEKYQNAFIEEGYNNISIKECSNDVLYQLYREEVKVEEIIHLPQSDNDALKFLQMVYPNEIINDIDMQNLYENNVTARFKAYAETECDYNPVYCTQDAYSSSVLPEPKISLYEKEDSSYVITWSRYDSLEEVTNVVKLKKEENQWKIDNIIIETENGISLLFDYSIPAKPFFGDKINEEISDQSQSKEYRLSSNNRRFDVGQYISSFGEGIVYWVSEDGTQAKLISAEEAAWLPWEDAKSWCQSYGNGSWKMPSITELDKIQKAAEIINATAENENLTKLDMGNVCYWSSTENEGKYAFRLRMNDGVTLNKGEDETKSSTNNRVRAILSVKLR